MFVAKIPHILGRIRYNYNFNCGFIFQVTLLVFIGSSLMLDRLASGEVDEKIQDFSTLSTS